MNELGIHKITEASVSDQPLDEQERKLLEEVYATLDVFEEACRPYHREAKTCRAILRLQDPYQDDETEQHPFRAGVNGMEMGESDYLMFAICDAETYMDVYSQFQKFENGEVVMDIPSSATSVLEAGDYYYDLRILRDVEVSGTEVSIDGTDRVWSLYAPKMPALTLAEVARNV